MLAKYRKENRKIAMGLLGFHKNLKEHASLLKEIDTYECDEKFLLFLFTPEGSSNIQGIVGIEQTSEGQFILHDISLNPSFRGERLGYVMLDELQNRYPGQEILSTKATKRYLEKWKATASERE